MGIFIHMAVSESVTQEEWTKAYEESLKLADGLNLSEFREKEIHGVKVDCLVKTKETDIHRWNGSTKKGWRANGDYNCLTVCEDNILYRDISYTPRSDAVDPLLALSRMRNCKIEEEDPWINDFFEAWAGKTQGEPQHLSLLAIGCMFEDRLKDKVLVFGDISRGQCMQAVDMANKILDRPIQRPDICDPARFFARIWKFPTDADKFGALDGYYLGVKDAAYGQSLRKYFSEETLDSYWRERFQDMPVDCLGYSSLYKEYLVQGFDLAKLCRFSQMTDKDGKDLTEQFVKNIMESELYIPEKDCEDRLELNTDDPGIYSIYSLLAQFVFGGMRNPRVDRYISLDEIRNTLREKIGNRCDVDDMIDRYLAKKKEKEAAGEKSSADLFSEMIDQKVEEKRREQKEYKISTCREMLTYHTGDSISPNVQEFTVSIHQFCMDLLEKKTGRIGRLLESSIGDKIQFLAVRSSALAIRDKDWEKIFNEIEEHPESYGRYGMAANVDITSDDMQEIIQAYLVNDELYQDLLKGKLATPKE